MKNIIVFTSLILSTIPALSMELDSPYFPEELRARILTDCDVEQESLRDYCTQLMTLRCVCSQFNKSLSPKTIGLEYCKKAATHSRGMKNNLLMRAGQQRNYPLAEIALHLFDDTTDFNKLVTLVSNESFNARELVTIAIDPIIAQQLYDLHAHRMPTNARIILGAMLNIPESIELIHAVPFEDQSATLARAMEFAAQGQHEQLARDIFDHFSNHHMPDLLIAINRERTPPLQGPRDEYQHTCYTLERFSVAAISAGFDILLNEIQTYAKDHELEIFQKNIYRTMAAFGRDDLLHEEAFRNEELILICSGAAYGGHMKIINKYKDRIPKKDQSELWSMIVRDAASGNQKEILNDMLHEHSDNLDKNSLSRALISALEKEHQDIADILLNYIKQNEMEINWTWTLQAIVRKGDFERLPNVLKHINPRNYEADNILFYYVGAIRCSSIDSHTEILHCLLDQAEEHLKCTIDELIYAVINKTIKLKLSSNDNMANIVTHLVEYTNKHALTIDWDTHISEVPMIVAKKCSSGDKIGNKIEEVLATLENCKLQSENNL